MRKQNSRIMGFESMLKHLARLKIKRGVRGVQARTRGVEKRVYYEASWHDFNEAGGCWGGPRPPFANTMLA